MTDNTRPACRFRVRCRMALPFIALFVSLWSGLAFATERQHPLKPIDTSSPRAVLQGFIEFMNEGYEMGFGRLHSYLESSRLYLTPEDMSVIRGAIQRLMAAERTIDFSALPPAMARESARRLTIQLKDILDRIDLPPFEAVPDAEAMAVAEFKRWTIPGTEIRVARIDTGPRAGEYLFTAETASRLPEFHERVRDLPSKPGASVGFYEFSVYNPSGVALALHRVVPPRWLLHPPRWATVTFLDQPMWRWMGIAGVLAAGLGVARAGRRLSRRWAQRRMSGAHGAALLQPITLVLVSAVAAIVLAEVLRVSGVVYHAATLSLWTLFFLALTWTVWAAGSVVSEAVIRSERLKASSIDSQLIRLVLRLITIVGAIAILIVGADRVGLPAYSVVAGLGVGGLAVALAGQQTLANLLGSLIVMVEKPFRMGDWIKVNGIEGTVERVGFRSTRLRTFYDSVVTIPSSELVNSTIDNMELRKHREVKTVLNVTYDTPAETVADFVEGIRQILETQPRTRKDNLQVAFHDFGPHSLDIWLKFFVRAPDRLAELAERQQILFEILKLADRMGVRFAFPTQTLHIESVPDQRNG